MTTRGPGFSEEEVAALLETIDEVLPNSPNDWERVTASHLLLFPDLKRNTKSLKHKFESLYNHKKPTGDPTCPVSVRKAKLIWEQIESRMDFLDAEGELGLDEEEVAAIASRVTGPEGVGLPAVAMAAPAPATPTGAAAQAAVPAVGAAYLSDAPSIIGQQVRTLRRHPSPAQPSTNTQDLIQFMMLRAELEDKRRSEREEREERRAHQREEAEDRRRAEEAEERRERTTMMQMFMMGMLDGQRTGKRKRDDNEGKNTLNE